MSESQTHTFRPLVSQTLNLDVRSEQNIAQYKVQYFWGERRGYRWGAKANGNEGFVSHPNI